MNINLVKNGGVLLLSFFAFQPLAKGQEWDDTKSKIWPDEFKEVSIESSVDGKEQKAYFYAVQSKKAKPLIVSLHTWSGNYQQKDRLIKEVLEKDYNYIHPDFRGPNYTSEACGSPLVTSDIDDAIKYAIQNGNVDKQNIHVIGVSGGGHATLLMYMQSEYAIRSFSAWVPISDITKWYYESKGRGRRYATHISLATTGDSTGINIEEARRRSPLLMETPVKKRENSKLYIYAGIHDGYNGSVPISHSLDFYNKVVKDFHPAASIELIPQEIKDQLIIGRNLAGTDYGKIGDRIIHFQNRLWDKVQIIIFEGGHEMLLNHALKHIPSETILTIGDSNGANKNGWVTQLARRQFNNTFINTCISGNTIGFDNKGYEIKNTLKNIEKHLTTYDPKKNQIDKILIMLGTNDSKKVFDNRLKEVPGNFEKLIKKINEYYLPSSSPEIIIISAPPIADDSIIQEKYHGGAKRIAYLNKEFKKIATHQELKYIDLYSQLKSLSPMLLRDGIHFNDEGYQLVGLLLDFELTKRE